MIYRSLRNYRGFFSDYFLGSVFGQSRRGRTRKTIDKDALSACQRFGWVINRAESKNHDFPAVRENLVRRLLDILGFYMGSGEGRIYKLFESADREAALCKPLALSYCGSWEEDLDAGRGNEAPIKQLENALAANDIGFGFMVTGHKFRLLRAPGQGVKGAYFELDLDELVEAEDEDSFGVFYSVCRKSSFLPDEYGDREIDRIEKESREHAQKVSEDLKRAVFTAAENLVQGLLEDSRLRGEYSEPEELDEASLRDYRDAALTALYRFLFILYAEARDPRLKSHGLYWKNYSLDSVVKDILHDTRRAWGKNSFTLWPRVKVLFKLYDQGIPRIADFENIPPRGGDFFSAKTEAGKILEPASLPDSIVANLLVSLTTSEPRRGVGRQMVSFLELDIESLGAVYEGLLEFEPRIALENMIELKVQGKKYVLAPSEVLRLCTAKSLKLRGDYEIVAGSEAAALHPDAPSEDAEEDDEEDDEVEDDDSEDSGEGEEDKGVKKGAKADLLKRIARGEFHFVPGAGRKSGGSFYTPLPLVRDLVRHAVGPLAEGKTAAEIERVRVLDPACGSGHFLVEVMRFLGKELHRAYVKELEGRRPETFTHGIWDSHWEASDSEARAANSEARAWCKRRIAERCLYGVDQNPTAVQLAQVALWIESLAGDRPLTFFEHHVKCGNSLIGTRLDTIDVPPVPLKGKSKPGKNVAPLFSSVVRQSIAEAAERQTDIDLDSDEPGSLNERVGKENRLREISELLDDAHLLYDLRCASAFVPKIWSAWEKICSCIFERGSLCKFCRLQPWWREFEKCLQHERFFHWELEFPEVCAEEPRGFDAVLGNPPWEKVKPCLLYTSEAETVYIR